MRVVRVDIPIMIAASAGLLVLSLDGTLSRLDGVVLFSGIVAFIIWTLKATRTELEPGSKAGDGGTDREPSILASILRLIAGIVVLAFAAQYVVSGAEDIAGTLGIPELIVGLTIVALGTSAPEIVTTVIAALKGQRELAVGNAVGSNIFNTLLVLGSSSAIAPNGIPISSDAIRLDMPIMVAAAIACLPIVFWDHKLDRWEGALFVAYYLAYLTFLVLDATGHRASDPFALVMVAFVMPLTAITIGVGIFRQRQSAQQHALTPEPRHRSSAN